MSIMKCYFLLALAVNILWTTAALAYWTLGSATQTTLAIPAGTVVGSVVDGVQYFRGIPYAKPPTDSRRLKPPERMDPFDIVHATGLGPACPQMTSTTSTPLFAEVLAERGVAPALFLGAALGNETEDCLTVSVMRPESTTPYEKLPVLFWVQGGGFEIGSAQPYNASVLIPRALELNKPLIFVSFNYRLGGFGVLGGHQMLADGSTNLGLLDQRMALEWVADNIAAFGGDPAAVTIWGESAGSLSVFNLMAMYDGNNTYKGRPLFRAGIMNSGSIVSQEPIEEERAQRVFDQVTEAAGCPSTAHQNPLECLRSVSYGAYHNATNSVPSFLSYESIALSYAPKADGKTLTASTDVLARQRKFAAVPLIVGNVENEGSLFALFQTNITTEAALVTYLHHIFHNATRAELKALVDTYPSSNSSANSALSTSDPSEPYPEFKRLASILGDIQFILARRIFLESMPAHTPTWSWIASWDRETPLIGTFHTADLPRVFYGPMPPVVPCRIAISPL